MLIPVKFKKLVDNVEVPQLANNDKGNVGYDVVATSINITDKYIEYGLGFSTEFPNWLEAQVRPRSSISKYDLVLCNSVGTVDSNYRGEWKVRFKLVTSLAHLNKKKLTIDDFDIYKVGDKVAQIVFNQHTHVSFNLVDDLNNSQRGTGGFGSTDEVL